MCGRSGTRRGGRRRAGHIDTSRLSTHHLSCLWLYHDYSYPCGVLRLPGTTCSTSAWLKTSCPARARRNVRREVLSPPGVGLLYDCRRFPAYFPRDCHRLDPGRTRGLVWSIFSDAARPGTYLLRHSANSSGERPYFSQPAASSICPAAIASSSAALRR